MAMTLSNDMAHHKKAAIKILIQKLCLQTRQSVCFAAILNCRAGGNGCQQESTR